MLFKKSRVAILAVAFPWHGDARRPPQKSTESETRRRHIRKFSVVGLTVAHRLEVLTEQRTDIRYFRSSRSIDGYIPHPTQALVALRAVGRDRDEITQCRPFYIIPQTVDQRIRALEMGFESMHRTYRHTPDRIQRQRLIYSRKFKIAVAVKGMAGSEHFPAITGSDIPVGAHGGT